VLERNEQDGVLGVVVAEQPQVVGAAGRSGAGRAAAARSYHAKIETGRRVAAAIEAKRQRDAARLLAALAPVAADVRVGAGRSDLTVLSASFLVDRKQLNRFDRALERVNAEEQDRLRLDCVGPLPPYSFTEIRV
jgi:hypothetical protein